MALWSPLFPPIPIAGGSEQKDATSMLRLLGAEHPLCLAGLLATFFDAWRIDSQARESWPYGLQASWLGLTVRWIDRT